MQRDGMTGGTRQYKGGIALNVQLTETSMVLVPTGTSGLGDGGWNGGKGRGTTGGRKENFVQKGLTM